jgi:hypothetical protein
MKLKSSLIFTAIVILIFTIMSTTSIVQIDKVFSKTLVSSDGNSGFFGDKVDKMGHNVGDILGIIFGDKAGKTPDSNGPNLSTSKPANLDNSGNKAKECIPGKCLGDKHYYTIKGHHHCFQGTPGCVKS